ncbi:uncharacterized protein LOC117645750 [Thrips palmi]|uniref:Uncharacterized protein LOC117645750 n=1 Tax=Thrips palmi TaxID=161013 RepID=A0A6P8YWU9_THRPL|nr:uncharacterized protein LOC117645750 [Thrips palmi]
MSLISLAVPEISEWQVLEAVVRVVLGVTLEDLVQRFALLFLTHKEAFTAPPTRTVPCRCRESRLQLEQLSMALASSGDSSDVNPAAAKHSTTKGRTASKGGVTIADRPPWRHCYRPSTPSMVLYEPPRVCATRSEAGEDVEDQPRPSASTASRPSVRQAETQTQPQGSQGGGPETCCRGLRSQILDLRSLITGLQKDMAGLMQDERGDLPPESRERWREGVEFWQQRYEDLKEEQQQCLSRKKEKRR